MGVVAPATIAMWFPLARQGMPMGIWATWVPVGNLIMFILAPVLVVSIGWQAIWWVGAIYALVMLFIYGSLVCQRPALQEDLPLSAELFQLDKTLANRDIWLLSLAFACFTLVMMSIGTYYPTYLKYDARLYIRAGGIDLQYCHNSAPDICADGGLDF